jgi:predicted acyl esterase
MAMRSWCRSCLLLSVCGALLGMDTAAAGDTLASEIPAAFTPHAASFDYVKRELMIPMRDGVKLQTLILIPRGAHRAPILLTRTPYGATDQIAKTDSAHLSALIDSTDVADDAVVNGGYIRVVQDVRGKHGSEGDYLMTRPLRGPLNPTAVDHATDTYDTIDWLVKNVPESNGKVGILGISYDGFTSLMALINPHPALRAAVKILAQQGVAVPVMLVHSLWDQEDIYGNIALYKALEAQDGDHSNLFLVLGPWFHHQQRLDGSRIGAIQFGSDTAEYFSS